MQSKQQKVGLACGKKKNKVKLFFLNSKTQKLDTNTGTSHSHCLAANALQIDLSKQVKQGKTTTACGKRSCDHMTESSCWARDADSSVTSLRY